MDEEEFVGCISCMGTSDLYDLFAVYEENVETYASLLETCFGIKVPIHIRYICYECVESLEKCATLKEQTEKNLAVLQNIRDEEYLDESILEEAESSNNFHRNDMKEFDDLDSDQIEALDGTMFTECTICGVTVRDPDDHKNRCHSLKSEIEGRKYSCHFCDNVYISKKACFTHLRMKHGLKLCNDQTPKFVVRERKKCHLCSRDFSQKQILNKHLMKAHGIEVEKRKAFICPLCDERVSYGSNFSAHLLHVHRVHEHVEQLEFHDMDDFMIYKSAIQEETKYRFRKTTASKQTIEGIRSHYMCSQSGVYVYQGKGKRPAPERQIYKTGKACPAHMIVTETTDRVLVTFYKTHVGHGPCPYFEPREPKKPKPDCSSAESSMHEMEPKAENEADEMAETEALICDACGMAFYAIDKFRGHIATHGLEMYSCQYCDDDFQNLESWSDHIRLEHNINIF
ncbi:zinc finger protein 26-like [Bombyx mandarina]|uniref:C2H2-type domain-containing protein n=2 Tax=Bombyx TaxID=7090 RepID=A0A8R2M818_BOMMO|nr:zinc finger protein 26-like [Bombyx mandarina]XP_037875693.1 zinc finger protein 26-like isoform X1 [Bombyx mori]XP_037875694.1 zinc finger protein 26-like isoform X2 [Bombyx mori]XP_037877261.1 zinc finger protein 26-like [Bombyx mori]